MKAKSVSGTWKWRKPTAWGLVILCVLAVVEVILLYYSAFPPSPFDSDENGMLYLASLVVGSLLLICASILLTERTSA